MNSPDAAPPMPSEARAIVDQADKMIARHTAEIAALQAKRNEVDRRFRVKAQEAAEEDAQRREARRLELTRGLLADEAARLAAVERLETLFDEVVVQVDLAFRSAEAIREKAHAIARLVGIERVSLLSLGQADFVGRMAGRIAAAMGKIKGHPHRFGGVVWAGGSLYAGKADWRGAEQRVFAGDIERVIETGRQG